MLLSLLFLIILSAMAYRSKRIVLSAFVFGALKAISSTFHYMAESNVASSGIILVAVGQFAINAILGLGIAYLVVKRSQDVKYVFMTTALAIFTFLTTMVDLGIVSRV